MYLTLFTNTLFPFQPSLMFQGHNFHLETSGISPEQWHPPEPAGRIINLNVALDSSSTSTSSRTGSIMLNCRTRKGKNENFLSRAFQSSSTTFTKVQRSSCSSHRSTYTTNTGTVELVSPSQTLIYVMCPTDHDIWTVEHPWAGFWGYLWDVEMLSGDLNERYALFQVGEYTDMMNHSSSLSWEISQNGNTTTLGLPRSSRCQYHHKYKVH